MKKNHYLVAGLLTTLLVSCGGMTGSTATSSNNTNGASGASVLGSVLGAATNGETLGNILGYVLGNNIPTEKDIYGTWLYNQPGVAFTSENALATAGGEVAATSIRQKLSGYYATAGFKATNTQLTFKDDKTFSGNLDGKTIAGTWSYDQKNQKITMNMLGLLSLPVYVQKTSTGMSFTMESKKLLTLLQTAASLSGNTTLSSIGELSKNFSGVRMGFEMKK